MCRGVFVALMGAVVLLTIGAMVMIATSGPAVMAQQGQPAAVPTTSEAKAQPPGAQQSAATQPTRGRLGAAPPGTHGVPGDPPGLRRDQIEEKIPPEERERLGLAEPTWTKEGKVHPDVGEILKTGQMPWVRFKGWEPIGLAGTAYVAVYLRHQQRGERTSEGNRAAIKETQSRVLSRLTAAEFSTVFTFKDTPGLLGYVSVEGVAKLEKDGDVTAVGLDETPLPEEPPPPLRQERPDVVDKDGRRHPPPPPQRIGKVGENVYEALKRNEDGYALVIVTLQHPIEWRLPYDEKQTVTRQMEDRILSTLTAAEFRLRGRGFALLGFVNAEGLAKLTKHPDVRGVSLEESFKAVGH